MKSLLAVATMFTITTVLSGCEPGIKEKQLKRFITAHVERIKPLEREKNLAFWDSATTGKQEDYSKLSELELKIRKIYSNSEDFTFLREIKESGEIRDAKLARQLDELYYAYLQNQVEPELLKRLVDLDNKIQEKYNTFRGTIDGKKVTMSDIYTILTTELDSAKREKAWRASKQVGDAIVDDLIELVKLRNEAARKLGFDNYHTLTLTVTEQDVKELGGIFHDLDKLTREPFAQLKADLDHILAAKYGIAVTELEPWHYHDPFFQRAPFVYELDLDVYYKNKDVKELAAKFYGGINLSVDAILEVSDLYDREGKNPHAFSEDVDREGDVRILCNLQDTERWMETILHELGHAVYDKYHDPNVPYLLREPAHSFTTEAVAMFFGRLSRNAAWMQKMLNLSDKQRAEIEKFSGKYMRLQQLIFARWAMVMYNFEKQLYANPDQDLNSLWWQMVEKYQLVKRPSGPLDAGWASKLHFTGAPCYYHNYMLGELLASQLHHHIVTNILRLKSDKNVSYVGQPVVGDFLRQNIFQAGSVYHWNEMITRATGEPLTPKYFVEQFVK